MKNLYGLSAGNINLNTGTTKYFNIFENNTAEDALVLIKSDNKYTVVSGSGNYKEYHDYLSSVRMFSKGRFIKNGTGILTFPNTKESLSKIKQIVNANKCSFWVFK